MTPRCRPATATRAAVFVALLLAAVPAGAGEQATAADGRAPPSAVAALPADATVVGHEGSLPERPDPLARPARLRSRDGLLGAAADAARAAGLAVVAADDAAHAASEEQPEGSWADVIPLGDVDGDGAEDVGIVDIALPDHGLTLRAVRGLDAAPLWSLPLDGAGVFVTGRDLTGDTAADLVRFAIPRYEVLVEDCQPDAWYCDRFLAEFDWEVQVISGRTLSPSWTARASGWIEETYRTEASALERTRTYHLSMHNGWVLPHLVAVPGGAAVLLDAWDLDDWWEETDAVIPVVFEETFTANLRSSRHLSLRRASDGAELASTTVGPEPATFFVEPVADLDGDGFGAVILEQRIRTDTDLRCTNLVVTRQCEGSHPSFQHVVTLLGGLDLRPRWSSPAAGMHGTGTALDVDVDGDGVGDLLHQWTGEDATTITAVLSGADGSVLWSVSGPSSMVGLGDVSGDGRDDLLQTVVQQVGGEVTVELRRLDGATGTPLGQTTHLFGQDGTLELGYVYVTDDQNRDGTLDVVVGRVVYGGGEPQPVRSAALVESGGSGAPLWQLDDHGSRLLRPLGDVSGGGTTDYDWSVLTSGGSENALVVDIRRGPDGLLLWGTEVSAEFGYVANAGDLDASGVDDVAIVADSLQGNRWSTQVRAVRGHDGVPRWTVWSQP